MKSSEGSKPSEGYVYIDKQGNIYVSDTQTGAIYKFVEGKFEEWLSGTMLAGINGLCVHKDQLLVGVTSDHSLKSVDLKTKATSTIARFGEGIMDGIKVDQEGNFLISHYEGRIYWVSPDGQFTKLLYVQEERCADFEFIPEKKLLVIPTLATSELMCYKLKN